MSFTEYIKSLIKANTLDSSKSFTLILSALVGALTGVVTIGYIRTDLGQLGIFLLCAGGFMAGGGATKAIAEMNRKRDNQIKKE